MTNERQATYTVLARRFRPQSFQEVVGQEHVGQALQNAIRFDRVAHAYLFTGARGVGKTSTARIFAKALNCPNVQNGLPCNQCEVCQAIAAGADIDVLEIDGASNRGIDDIRQLRANVGVRSMRSPHKVYIIDEVHMLTKEAFNALLKTLEEPPANVNFVFCTTEPNKVPDTILSRCQRFDFGTIEQASIAGRLQQIAQAEGRDVTEEAIELVARRANGSMRDSQSLFDQLLAFGGEQIGVEDVHRLLGTTPDDRLIELIDACLTNHPGQALERIEAALQQGVQIGSLTDQLLGYTRDLLVTAAGAEQVPLSTVSERSRPRLQEQAQRWGLQTISAAMQIVAEAKSRMQRSTFGRALLELAVVRMATLEQLDRISDLLAGNPPTPMRGEAPAPRGTAESTGSSGASLRAAYEASRDAVKKNISPPAVNPASLPAHANTVRAEDSDQKLNQTPSQTPRGLSAAGLDQFWAQVLSQVTDILGNHLKNASSTAIFGPNALEILFPRGYAFSQHYCERAEVKKRLSAILAEIAGHPVDITFRTDPNAPESSAPAEARPERRRTAERFKVSTVDGDDFVQKAVTIFGGQIVEVRPLLTKVVAPETADEPETQD